MERSTVRVFHSKANMGPLYLLFASSKRSSLFSYGLRGKQLTLIASKRNTTIGLGPHTTTMLVPVSDRDKMKGAACIRFQ